MIINRNIYHGTSESNAKNILNNGFNIPHVNKATIMNKPQDKKPGSLGFGVYGFLESIDMAKDYYSRISIGNDRCVLNVELSFFDEFLFDFANTDDIELFEKFKKNSNMQMIISNFKSLGYSNKYTQHELEGILIEYFIMMQTGKSFEKIDVISCPTHTKRDNDQNEIFYSPNGVEYCVRKSDIIENISIVNN